VFVKMKLLIGNLASNKEKPLSRAKAIELSMKDIYYSLHSLLTNQIKVPN